jgi:NTE family protein
VVYREGALTQAMRASMAVPGLLAPVEHGGRKLVDGGLVDNVPIAEVRERCGAEVVIAVNVGSPLLRPEDIGGLLSISAQMVALLTEQNVSRSLATLEPTDIYLQPDLGTITAASFDRHAEAADRGRAAAEAIAGRLQALAVDEARFAAWRQRVDGRQLDVPRIDHIEIAGLGRVNPAVVRRHLEQTVGQPLDTEALHRDLLRAYGDGHYAGVDYTLVSQRGRTILRITPIEKPWGPDYLRAALTLESTLNQGSTYQLRLGYQKTWLNRLGGELLLGGEIGSSTGLGAEWYQPLDAAQRFFVDLQADFRRERLDLFAQQRRVAELRVDRQRGELTAGVNLALLGQARFGWRHVEQKTQVDIGLPLLDLPEKARVGGWLLAVDLDRLDRLYFPTRGWALRGNLFDARGRDYTRLNLELRAATPWEDWIVAGRLRAEGSVRGRLPLDDAAHLGGFLNLSGFAKGQLIGDDVLYGHVRAERIIGRLPLGLRGDMRLGTALEFGRIGTAYNPQRHSGWLGSLALYLGGETPIGSVYLGFGQGRGGARNAYLFIGTP